MATTRTADSGRGKNGMALGIRKIFEDLSRYEARQAAHGVEPDDGNHCCCSGQDAFLQNVNPDCPLHGGEDELPKDGTFG